MAYEEATEELLVCDADSAEYYITERGRLASEIDDLTEEIGRVCDGAEGGDVLFKAATMRIGYDDMPPEMRPAYDLCQQTRTIIYRISELEPRVLARMEAFREEARDYMKNNQNVPKIKKYLTDLGEDAPINLTNNKA